MDLINLYGKYKEPIKEVYGNNTKKMKVSCIKKDFPELIEMYDTHHKNFRFKDILYCIINGLDSIPKCAMCDNYVEIKDYVKGFRKCCSVECRQKYEKTEQYSKSQSTAISGLLVKDTHKYDYLFAGYDYEYVGWYSNYNYILKNYCCHGNVGVYIDNALVLNEKRKDHEGGYCLECNKELFESYIPTEDEYNNFLLTYKDFYKKNHFAMDRDFWIRYYPKTYKMLILYYKNCCEPGFVITLENVENDYLKIIQETNYCILNDITERPKCPYPGCNKERSFYNIHEGYLTFCEEHKHQTHVSGQELGLYDYIKGLGLDPQRNSRDVINGCELDFYFPDISKAIEYNGVWFHSLKVKPDGYHLNKFLKCKEDNIGLLCIWEDVWKNRPLACEERIKRHCFEAKALFTKLNCVDISKEDFVDAFSRYSLDSFDSIRGERFCVISYESKDKMYINYDVENDTVRIRTMFSVGIYNDNWYCDVVIGWFTSRFDGYRCLVIEEDADTFTMELLRRCGDNYVIEDVNVKANKGERDGYNKGVDDEGCYDVEMTGRLIMSFYR